MSARIRLAEIADASVLGEIERAAFDPRYYSSIWRGGDFKRAIRNAKHILLVATLEEVVCGYALGLTRVNSRMVRFYSLAVHPNAKHRALGESLFFAMENEVSKRGYKLITLEIRKDNAFLLRRYEGYGYDRSREVDNYYPDGCACIRMTKSVGSRD
jgi:ribosomal protein S18 acetylase RimI-like enzyme